MDFAEAFGLEKSYVEGIEEAICFISLGPHAASTTYQLGF
jgi:hypothetical protein